MKKFYCSRCGRAHDIPAIPRAVLLHTRMPGSLRKLKEVLGQARLTFTKPIPETILVGGDAVCLERVLSAWHAALNGAEVGEARGVYLQTPTPTIEDLAMALLNLASIDFLLAQFHGQWLLEMLGDDALFPVFQPLLSVAEKHVVAYEALLRGRMEGEVIGAAELFDTARAIGQLVALDQKARFLAIRSGQRLLGGEATLFVNLEPNTVFDSKHGLRSTLEYCARHGMPMNRLVFEVVEAEEVKDLKLLKGIIDEYRALGARVALDDLGSGYSSIRYMAELQPDFIKLDQDLVHTAHAERVRAVLLRAITAAAHELGVEVIAEGVETETDFLFCRDIGADFLQGNFIAPPAQTPPAASPESLRLL